MRTRRRPLLCGSALALAMAAGWALAPAVAQDEGGGDEAPAAAREGDVVRARRYETVVFGSALDLSHGAGQRIVELWFPDAGIVCNLSGGAFGLRGMNAFFGEPRYRLDEFTRKLLGDDAPPAVDDPPEIDVPRAFYERIRELAEITRRRQRAAEKLRHDLAATELFRMPD